MGNSQVITVFTPPPTLRRQMIRTTMRVMEAVPEGTPTRAFLELQLDFIRRDCPHEHITVVVPSAGLCQDCFSGFPIRIEELQAPVRAGFHRPGSYGPAPATQPVK